MDSDMEKGMTTITVSDGVESNDSEIPSLIASGASLTNNNVSSLKKKNCKMWRRLNPEKNLLKTFSGYFDMGQTITFDPMIVYPTNGSHILFTELKRRLLKDSRLFDQVRSKNLF